MLKTKIVCTIGPACEDEKTLKELMLAGASVIRFNFSHANYERDREKFKLVDKLRNELGLHVGTMLDTKGPEIRLGKFKDSVPVIINDGDEYTLTTEECVCDEKKACISFKGLPKDVSIGTRLLINDGLVELKVKKVCDTEILCDIIHGGKLSDRKSINVPGIKLSLPYISNADMEDLKFGAELGFDFVAASFVRSGADVIYLRKFLESLGWYTPRIIAKIENMDGVKNIDEILEAAEGVLVARGDMGVEIPFEQIPALQKEIIHKAYNAGKQVITATQMLESMINNPRPTRAEITDVANAIYDGTSAIMLSGETAAGNFPVEAVKTMASIAKTTEKTIDYSKIFSKNDYNTNSSITNAISHATVTTAHDLNANAIITVTKKGSTARMISKYRPFSPIIGMTTSKTVCRQLALSWGIYPALLDEKQSTDELIEHAIIRAKECGFVKENDLVVVTAGVPLGVSGTTNLLQVEIVK